MTIGDPFSIYPPMRVLASISVLISVAALLAPAAHVLEMVNKLQLDGPLWLAIQQHLYRGWGPLIGAPTEIAGVLLNALLFARLPAGTRARRLRGLAACSYLAMIAVFFAFNSPVNAAVNSWTSETLPSNWQHFRMTWELGHALAAVLAVIALLSVARAASLSPPESRAKPSQRPPITSRP